MELLTPAALWWLLALGVLLLLPFVWLPRERRSIGSLHLWRQSPTDERPRPLVRLRRNLQLLLQAAAIVAIVASLAQPALLSRGRTVAVIVDLSASMAARDGGGTRMDAARARARDVIGGLPFGSRVRLFGAGGEVTSLGEFSARGAELRSTIDALEPGPSPAAVAAAIDTARATTDGEIVVISDAPSTVADRGVRWIGIGSPLQNIAVTAFAARQLPGSPFDAQLLAEVRNYSDAAVTCSATVSSRISGPIHAEVLSLAPGGSRVVAIDLTGGGGEYEMALDHADALPSDNVWRTVLSTARVKVAISGSVSRFVRSALDANSALQVVADEATADVIVCGGGCDGAAVRSANVMLIPASEQAGPPLRIVDRRHELSPVVAGGSFAGATTVSVPPDARVIARSGGAPAVATWRRGNSRTLLLGINANDTGVVYDTAFPLLIAGGIDWLSPQEVPGADAGIPAEESDLRAGAATTVATGSESSARDTQPSRVLLFSACLLLALAVMSVEWRLTCRRTSR